MGEQVHQRDQPAVAPAHDADALRVDVVVVLQHPLPAGEHVLDLQPAVVDQLPELLAVAGAAAVLRRDDRVALLEQLAQDVDVVAVDVAVNAAVDEDDQRQLLSGEVLLGQEGVGRDDDGITTFPRPHHVPRHETLTALNGRQIAFPEVRSFGELFPRSGRRSVSRLS